MKNLLLILLLSLGYSTLAQAPQKFTYQSVIRDANDNLIQNGSIGIQINIIQGSPTGSAVYQEQHTSTTNGNGLVTLEIGTGNILSGTFSSIDWGNGPYFIETETDPNGGTNYSILGNAQFLSVPYALYAETAETVVNDQVNDADSDPNNELQDITLTGTDLTISNGSTVDLSTIQDGVNDADSDPANELQDITLTGTDLSISNGSTVDLSIIQDGVNDADSDPANELQDITLTGTDLTISNGSTVDLSTVQDGVNDADSDPTNEIELPQTANVGDLLEFDGNDWIAVTPTGGSGPGAVMYIYDGQTCPAGWSTQQINVAIFGGVPVDACYTDSPCTVMYIYDGQTCPTGWTHQSIGAAVINGSTTPVDACFKCN